MQLEEDACSSAVRGIELAREERGEALRRVAELQATTETLALNRNPCAER